MNDRLADIPSQIMKIIRMAAMVEIWAPKLDIKFHGENASGQSEYRRGRPFSPIKCWGKKVMFTPKSIKKNCVLDMWLFKGVS